MKKLIIFYADWCGPCKAYQPIYEKVAEDLGIEVKRVNIEDSKEMQLYEPHNIRSVPTTLVVDGFEPGSVVREVEYGAISEHNLRELLK